MGRVGNDGAGYLSLWLEVPAKLYSKYASLIPVLC